MPALLVPVAPALADEKVTNFGKPVDATTFVIGHTSGEKKEAGITFRTGSNALGYDLNSVKLKFGNKQGSPQAMTILLRSDSSGSPAWPALATGTFTGPASPVNQDATYTLSSPYRLTPNTTYWITLGTSDTSSPNIFHVKTTSSTDETTMNNDTGWSIGNKSSTWKTNDEWKSLSWYDPLYLSVDADNVVATLAASDITTTGATLTISGHGSGSWYYKADKAPYKTPCSAVSSGTTASLSGLTAGTAYTFKAYNDRDCSNTKELTAATSDAEFTTNAAPTLTASSVTDTTATLTLANVSGNAYWFAKYTSPSDGTCPNAATSWADNVTGLSANTSYTFKAYKDNGCNNEYTNDTTDAEFTTKPGKPTKPVAAGSGSGQLTLTASVTGTGEIIKWQYRQKEGTDNFGDWVDISSAKSTSLSYTVTGLTNGTGYQFKVRAENDTGTGAESEESDPATPAAPSSSTPTPTTSTVSFPPSETGNATGQTGPRGVPVYNNLGQKATEGESIQLNLPSAETSNNQPINYKLEAYAEADSAEGAALADRAAAAVSANTGNWRRYEGLKCSDPNIRPVNCTVTDDNPPEEVLVVLTATVGSGASASSTSISFLLKIIAVNDAPRFEEIGAQTATTGQPFSLTVPTATDPEGDPITSYRAALQQEDGRLVAPGEPGWPGWLAFDAATRTFSGTPKAADAPSEFIIKVSASDGKGEGSVTFTLKVEAKTNARLTEVSRQWLARFGRTVSSQVVESIADRLSDDASASSIVLGGYPLGFAGESPVVSDSDRSSSSVAHSTHGTHSDLFTADPFAPLLPSTRERLNKQSSSTSPTSRELLTGSSFRISLNPGTTTHSTATTVVPNGTMATATTQDRSNGASGSVASATTAPGGGGWTVWGEAAYNRFDSEADDLSVQGGVLTGVAALDWKQDQWLLGMAVSRSEGDGEFEAPATAGDEAVAGTVSSSLTALYPYARIRPQPGVELWGAAGYGRGTMTLEAEDGSGAKPDIWLTMAAVGGRGSLLTAEQTGGPALDLTADALFTRTGAEAAGSLRDAVDADTTRLRMGVESSWDVQNADGTTVVPTLSAALRYDTGDAETGLGVELGSGLTYTSPGSGISLSAEVRGLLSNQDGDDGIGLREWGTSGSIRYDRDADDLGLTVALSPSWGVTGSRADQLWSEAALPFATAGDNASNGAGRLDGEVGYGFAAFNGTVTPYGGLGLADGSRHWRIGSRFSLPSGLDFRIEGSRNEQQRETPDHGIRLNLNTAW